MSDVEREVSLIWDIASQKEMLDYIQSNLGDPWVGTPFQGYRLMGNKQKGEYGEKMVREYFTKLGKTVSKQLINNGGHDLVVDGMLVEVKFSLQHTDTKSNTIKEDCFTMNHVAIGKDWERLVFVGVNKDDVNVRMKFITKEQFIKMSQSPDFQKYFQRQQGGKHSDNDDYISSDAKLRRFMNSPYVLDITEWDK